MIENIINEFTISSESGIIPIVDMISTNLVTSLVGTLAATARFVITCVRQQVMANMAVRRNPHADIGVGLVRCGDLRPNIAHLRISF